MICYPYRHMAIRKFMFILVAQFLFSSNSFANIKKWAGAGGDGLWSDAANWADNIVPSATDDVLLDNSLFPAAYTITLPDTAVVIRTLTISPGVSKTIQLTLPPSNIVEPAFSAMGPGYGVVLNNGSIFLNASGLTSGESLVIMDSFKINNGGRYIHHTKASHANNISRILSSAEGTEKGIFEFDVPRASYTVSVSNRIYGSMVFSSTAAGGTIAYTCNGTNPLTVNGDFQINTGVNFSTDLRSANGNIIIKGNYIQTGGIFNIASGAGNTTNVSIRGDLLQSSAGLITETNTGFPFIELNGSSPQIISLAGSITNDIDFRMNNSSGAMLSAPLRLPYKLELIKGKIITSATNLLTLGPNGTLTVDSTTSNTSFIDGPFRKEGLNATPSFLFPVGKSDRIRWLELKNVTGNFSVEYIKSDPRSLGNVYGAGIDHISSVEYWDVDADANPVPSANVELSFVVPYSGRVTDLNYLNIASLSSGIWDDAGHTAVTGAFNTAGSIVGNNFGDFANAHFFTLASTANLENPLPLILVDFDGNQINHSAIFHWQIDMPASYFELMKKDVNDFTVIGKITASTNKDQYQFTYDELPDGISYYRLRVTDIDGRTYLSKIISIKNNKADFTMVVAPCVTHGNEIHVEINSSQRGRLEWLMIAMDGRIMKSGEINVEAGNNIVSLNFTGFASGIYQLVGVNERKQFYSVRFVKE